MKRALVPLTLLVLLFAGCSSDYSPAPAPPGTAAGHPSWLALAPEDVRTFDGPGGQLLLMFVDETYDIDGTYASALTWRLGEDYTTDYFVEDGTGSLWWYGRKGDWRAGRHGEEPRLLLDSSTAAERAAVELGDRTVILEQGTGPVQVETPQGVYLPDEQAESSM